MQKLEKMWHWNISDGVISDYTYFLVTGRKEGRCAELQKGRWHVAGKELLNEKRR